MPQVMILKTIDSFNNFILLFSKKFGEGRIVNRIVSIDNSTWTNLVIEHHYWQIYRVVNKEELMSLFDSSYPTLNFRHIINYDSKFVDEKTLHLLLYT
jgi:hypothetical protein